MKRSLAIIVGAVALSAAGMSLAQSAKAPASMAAAAQPASTTDMKGQMAQMDEHMKVMQALHDRMTSAKTPDERQQVMIAQRQEMQGCMAGMSPMMHGGAMTGGAGGGMMNHEGKAVDANTQMQMMQKRMDMMQLMMQTMMDQQEMMAGSKPL